MRWRVALALLAAAAAVAVIVVVLVSDSPETPVEAEIEREVPLEAPAVSTLPPQTGDAVRGRSVFAQTGCGNCHTLAAAGSNGTIGPELDGRRTTYERVLNQVNAGGGGMPAYTGVLTEAEIQDVVAFTLESIERGGG